MKKNRIKELFENGEALVWNDPSPIDGNNYEIQKILYIDDETAMIQYGRDPLFFSEAEVYLHEIGLRELEK